MNNFEETSQTNFSFEEPISSNLNVDMPVYEKPVEDISNKKNNKKKMIIIGVIIIFFILLILVVAIKLRKKPTVELIVDEPDSVSRNLGPLEERIENARMELEIADPSNQDLTFPPVDMELRLDKKER